MSTDSICGKAVEAMCRRVLDNMKVSDLLPQGDNSLILRVEIDDTSFIGVKITLHTVGGWSLTKFMKLEEVKRFGMGD